MPSNAFPSSERSLLLLWRSLGPYHLARAAAAEAALRRRAVRTVVAELSDAEETRDWQRSASATALELRTLAPGVRLNKQSRDLSRRMIELLDDLRPDYVAVAGYDRPEMRSALRWANREGAAAILMSETKWDDRPRPWWRRALAARCVRRADAALVSGGPAGEYLVTLGMKRERVFRPYGTVDNQFFQKYCDQRPRSAGRPYFLACSRLIERRKNVTQLLFAYARYRTLAGTSPWDLVICGDGADRARLEHVVSLQRVAGVTFTGFQQIDALSSFYAGACCFVHPAVNEAWGLVVNEAMACGLPVLVSRRCGCAYDLVNEGINGFTFNPNDVDELTRLMVNVAARPPEERAAMGAESRRIVSRFGCEQFAAGLMQAMEAADCVRGRSRLPIRDRAAGRIDASHPAEPAADASARNDQRLREMAREASQ